jgi:hypothetical protein
MCGSQAASMDDFERRNLPADLDTLTLRRVIELWIYHDIELVLICRTPDCRRRAKVDLIDRIDRFGAESMLGEMRKRSCCGRCNAKSPEAFFVIESARRFGEKWFPRAP